MLTEGIVLIDKPAGQTSFQSLGALKQALGTRRVGHAGTLDRFAEGLLVVLAGRMTRLCPLATSLDKEYVAAFRFGQETDTLDPEGSVIGQGPVPSRRDIEQALEGFRGIIQQVPPAYSAIHVSGRRASEAARNGEEVELKPRTVTVYRLELMSFEPPEATFRISCSKGTYVRSLARDLGRSLGSRAHVRALRRTRIGGFRVEEAHRPEAFRAADHLLPPSAFFSAVPTLTRLCVLTRWNAAVSQGARLSPEMFEDPPDSEGIFGAFSSEDRLLAVIERRDGRLQYLAAFPELPAAAARLP